MRYLILILFISSCSIEDFNNPFYGTKEVSYREFKKDVLKNKSNEN